jgi:alpha-glucosidase
MSVLAACTAGTDVSSPDGKISVRVSLTKSGAPQYAVCVNGKPFVEESALGLVASEVNLADGFKLVSKKVSKFSETWTQPWGQNKVNTDNHKELEVKLRNPDAQLTLRFRVFDDGIGFRYEYAVGEGVIAGSDRQSLIVTDELTAFRFASDATSWSIPGDFNSYEHEYRQLPLSEVQDANTPFTMKFAPDLYASVHEAAIVDFSEMVLVKTDSLGFKASLAPRRWHDEDKALVKSQFKTPWRLIQIVPSAVALVNSSLMLNLNEPCALEDVSWIKPMKYVGVWWGMHLGINSWGGPHHGATTKEAIRYIDFAAANNIQGVLFEGWNDAWVGSAALPGFDFTSPAADFDVDYVTSYAAKKGISYITHNETGGNFRHFDDQLESSFDWAAAHGIHAVKTGYAGGGLYDNIPRHSQIAVNHFARVAAEAAKRQIMVDGHEVIKGSGLSRTYPNFMTRECARGMEYNGWSSGNVPAHHEILPFTRLLSGPMDYTPGIFDILNKSIVGLPQVREWGLPGTECRVNTTLAKQIALWVVLYSPLQMAADLLQNYEGHPAFQFFRDFNPDSDASEALQGEIGEYIAIVRRAGEEYFYGAVTNEDARTLEQPLSFLKPGVTYTATIYADAPDADWVTNPYAYVIEKREVTSETTLTLPLAPGGGVAISFTSL